jgi:predicted PurR-regulated permease PerM
MAKANDEPEEISLRISTETIIKVIVMIVGTIILLAALRKAAHALLLVFTAFFLALALNAPVSWVSHHLPGKTRGAMHVIKTATLAGLLRSTTCKKKSINCRRNCQTG